MRKSAIMLIFVITFLIASNSLFAQIHPRLLVDSSDIVAINIKVNDSTNVFSFQLYKKMKTYCQGYANNTIPFKTSSQLNTRFAQVAFVAMLENNNTWKDNMINLALQFNRNFIDGAQPIDNSEEQGFGKGDLDDYFSRVFYTLASTLIYDFCYDRMNSTEKDSIVSNILYGMNAIRHWVYGHGSHYKYFSYNPMHDSAYLLAALSIVDDTPLYTSDSLAVDLVQLKTNMFDANYGFMNFMFGDEGSYLDGVNYLATNFGRTYLALIALSKFEGIDYFHISVVENSLGKVSKWLSAMLLPNRYSETYYDFVFNGLSDAWNTYENSFVNLLVLAEKYQDGNARWIFNEIIGTPENIRYWDSNYKRTHDPEVFIPSIILYNEFPATAPDISEHHTFLDYKRGLISWRTGWEEDDLMFSFESTPVYHKDVIPIRHIQADKGNITLTAYGNNFIFDPNGGNSSDDVNRVHLKTEANNYINVGPDGYGEATIHGDDGRFMNDGHLKDYEDYDLFSTITARTSAAFDTLYFRDIINLDIFDEDNPNVSPAPGFVNPVEKAERTVFYLKQSDSTPFYFWVIDEIQKYETVTAEYDWHLLTRTYNEIDTSANPVKIYRNGYNDTLDVYIVKPEPSEYHFQFGYITESSWWSESKADKVSIMHEAIEGKFNVLLIPTTSGLPDKTYSNFTMSSGSGVKVDWSNGFDDYLFYSEDNCIEYASSYSDANQVFLRENNNTNKYSQYFLRNGSELNFEGIQIADLYGTIATVVCDSDIVHIKGDNITKAKIYAPYAEQLLINDLETPFNRFNDFIRIGEITENETWTGNIELNVDQAIAIGAEVTINPGTVIKFEYNVKLEINGTLSAIGTSLNPITFSRLSISGNWNGIEISGSNASASFAYCTLEYAGSAIKFENNANGTVLNSTVNNNYYGIYISSAEPVISNCDITNNNYGLRIWDSYDPVWNDNHISGNTILNNGYAMYLVNSSPTFAGNLIQSNHRGVALWYSSNPIFINNDVVENNLEGISCYGSASPDMYFNPVYESGGYNHITSNGYWGIRVLGSSNPNLGNPNTSMGGYNTIEDNTSYEVYNLTTNLIFACNNWWGSASGPNPGDIYGSVRWVPYLTGPPDPQRSAPSPPTFVYNPQIRHPAELQLAYYQQMTANFQNSASLFKSYFTNFRASSFNSLAAVQYVKSLNYCLDPSDVVNEIENTLSTAQDTIVKYELLSAQAAAMVKSGQANTAIQKLDLALALDVGLENRNRLLFQKAFIYIYRLNNTRQGEIYLQQILNNSQPGSDDYRLAMEELNLLNTRNRSLPKLAADSETDKLPQEYCLHNNFPNPFNPSTTITFELPKYSQVEIVIYDALGKKIKTLLLSNMEAGIHKTNWDGKDQFGKHVSSGIYFYSFKVKALDSSKETFTKSSKLLLLR